MGRAVWLSDREVEEQFQFQWAPGAPAPWLTNQSGWEVRGVLTDRLQQAVGPVAVELAVAFPCPLTLPFSEEICNWKGTFYSGLYLLGCHTPRPQFIFSIFRKPRWLLGSLRHDRPLVAIFRTIVRCAIHAAWGCDEWRRQSALPRPIYDSP